MIRIVLAGIGIAALLFGCESKAYRQDRTEPESHFLRKSQSPLLMDYKEILGRQIRDVSPDGKFILVGRDDGPNWAREVVNTESTDALGQLKGESGFGIRSKFLPGSNYVFIEEHIFGYKLWEFGKKNRVVGCGTGKMDSLAVVAVGEALVRVSFGPNDCLTTTPPGILQLVSAVSPDGHRYLTNVPTLGPYKQIEVRRAADFGIAGRIDAGKDRSFEYELDQPPRYTADGKFIVALVQANQDPRLWYLNVYEADSLQLISEMDITEWNPQKDRVAQKEDSLSVPPHFGPMIVISPDRRLAAIGTYEDSFRLFDLRSRRELAHSELARPPFVFTPDGTKLITDHAEGVRIWNLEKVLSTSGNSQ